MKKLAIVFGVVAVGVTAYAVAQNYPSGYVGPPDYRNNMVQGLQGYCLSNAQPTSAQVLTWDAPTTCWKPAAGIASSSVAVGTTAVTGGTTLQLLFNNAGVLGNESLASLLVSPPAIGGTTPAAGSFTTLGATGAITSSGTNVFSGPNNTFTALAGVVNPLTISTATFTPVLGSGVNQAATLVNASCPCTIANPSDTASHIGQAGVLVIKQSSTGSDTIGTWGSQFVTPGGVATITLSTAANATDYIPYYVADATHVVLGALILRPTH